MQIENDPLTRLVLTLFRANQAVTADGDQLAAEFLLTSAQWKVLGAIALSGQALSAAQVGRAMGLSRQAALKQIDLLLATRLIASRANPSDARAPLHELTAKGSARYESVLALWSTRAAQLSEGLDPKEIEKARLLLETLISRVESLPRVDSKPHRQPLKGNRK